MGEGWGEGLSYEKDIYFRFCRPHYVGYATTGRGTGIPE